jgi:chorismate synthase
MQTKCSAVKSNGEPCSGTPFKDHPTCWFHTPEEAARRAEGRKLGGSARSNQNRARKQLVNAIMAPDEVGGLLSLTLRNVITGRIEPGIANAAANLARAILAVNEATTLETRLAALEAAVEASGPRRLAG